MLIISVPLIIALLIFYIIRKYRRSERYSGVFFALFAVLLAVYELFVLTFAAGFYMRDIGKIYGIDRREISLDELYEATVICAENANKAYNEKFTASKMTKTLENIYIEEYKRGNK